MFMVTSSILHVVFTTRHYSDDLPITPVRVCFLSPIRSKRRLSIVLDQNSLLHNDSSTDDGLYLYGTRLVNPL